MQLIFLLLPTLLLLPSMASGNNVAKYDLPIAIRIKLDKRFPGWRFANVGDEIRRALKEYAPEAQPELVRGDFDGNGKVDYALLIEQGEDFNNEGVAASRKIHLVALLRNRKGYRLYHVASPAGDYLLLWKKGNRLYNYETQKKFILANDAVEAVTFEKAGTTYVYKKGKFRAILTGD